MRIYKDEAGFGWIGYASLLGAPEGSVTYGNEVLVLQIVLILLSWYTLCRVATWHRAQGRGTYWSPSTVGYNTWITLCSLGAAASFVRII